MKKLFIILAFLLPLPSFAADNAVTLTAGAGVTMRTRDIGAGVQSPYNILGDIAGAAIYGTAGAANTNVITVQGIASGVAQPVTMTSTTITGTVAATQSGTWTVQPGNTANTTPWLMSPSTGGNTAAVKAASTAPAATDPALVVSISPNSVNANGQATMANSAPVVVASNQSAIPVNGAVNVTPTTCSGTIATGGTAQNAITAGATLHGFTIANIDTSEVLWINFIGTAAPSGTDSFPLAPATATTFASLSSYTTPLGAGYNTNLSVIAATTAHKFSCSKW